MLFSGCVYYFQGLLSAATICLSSNHLGTNPCSRFFLSLKRFEVQEPAIYNEQGSLRDAFRCRGFGWLTLGFLDPCG